MVRTNRPEVRGCGPRRARGAATALALALAGAAAVAPPALTGCAGTSAEQKQAPVIRDLEIDGTKRVSARKIKKKIVTEETGWWPFAREHRYDPVAWQSDLARIVRLYESRGFYQAEVTSDEVRPDGEGGVEVKAVVSEGEPTKIGALEIRGLEELAPGARADVLEDLPLKAGDVFQEGAWDAAKAQLLTRLRDLGHAEAEVDARAQVDVKTRQAALLVVARPGRRYFFGDVEVKLPPGSILEPLWIYEQVRIAIPQGQPFSDEALDEAQRRLFAMGVLATAKVTLGTPDRERGVVGVLVDAAEGPFHTLRAGGGARFDQIRNEARLTLEWTNRNFRGGMRRLMARAQAGWAFIPNAYAVLRDDVDAGARHGPIARLGLELEQPRLFGRPTLRGRGAVDLDRSLEQAYDSVGGRLSVGVVWQPRAALTLFPSYNLQAYWLQGPALASAATAPLALGCITAGPDCFVVLSYLEQVVIWDRRDDRLAPRRGFYASLSLQEGGGPLLGDFTYLRVLPELRGYTSVGDDDEVTFAARLRVGELWPRAGQESAAVSRFYAGGGVSMRGFSDRRLSPMLLAPAPASSSVDPVLLALPIGGNGMIDGSFEARFRVSTNLILAAFVDYGQVTQDRIGPGAVRDLLWAVGVGVRYLTPVGPIRLDIARRLQVGRLPPLLAADLSGAVMVVPYEVNDSCFGIGGSSGGSSLVRDNLCVLHISIGEAF